MPQAISPLAITATPQAVANAVRNVAAAGFLALGLWFLARRLVGAFSRPLTLAEMSVCGALLIVASSLISIWSICPAGSRRHGWADRWPRIATFLSIGCFGVALSLRGTSYASLSWFWMLVLFAILVPTVGLVRQGPSVSDQTSAVDRVQRTDLPLALGSSWPAAVVADASGLEKDIGGEISQQMVRETVAADHERVSGLLRVSFAPGQQLAVVHAGFCPPLSRVPCIEVLQMDGPLASVNPTQVLPYGVGFDVRLHKSPATGETVRIAFTAMT